jgi:hypothetical protein
MLDELSDASLLDRAGRTIYDRGVAYAEEGRVRMIRDGGDSATFEVTGEHVYSTELYFEDLGLHVVCACPYAQSGSFCKHMVAAGLLWRQHLGGDAFPTTQAKPPKSERSTKAAQTRAANRERLKVFVAEQPAAELANRLWQRAEIDSDLMAELKAWAATARANDDPKALRQAVNDLLAFSTRRITYGRDVWSWAERARKIEPLLRRSLEQSPETARGIAEHALRRVYAASQYVDDSDGEVGGVMRMLIAMIIEAVQRAPPAAAWANRLVALLDDDPFGQWDVDHVLDVAGDAVARAFSRLVVQRWDEVERGPAADAERDHARRRARDLMLRDFRRRGDEAAGLDFMRRTARGLFEHADVIRTFDEHGRHREAIALAQAACKEFHDHRIVEDLLLAAYQRDGWDAEVWQIRQRRFADEPSVANYQALLDAAAAAKKDVDAERAKAYAGAAARDQARHIAGRGRARRYGEAADSDSGLLVSTTAAMLLHDGDLARALELVQPPNRCDPRLLEALAERLPRDAAAAAFVLLDRVVHFEMQHAQTPYTAPLRAVTRALTRLDSNAQTGYVAQLKLTYKAKRNFVAGLP